MEYLTLEQRISAAFVEFQEKWIEYDSDFVAEQVTEIYPWEDIGASPAGWKVAYPQLYPTRDARDKGLGIELL